MHSLSNSVEAPKKRNVSILLQKLALKHGVELVKLTATDVENDFIDKLLGRKREYIQFTAESKTQIVLENFWKELLTNLK